MLIETLGQTVDLDPRVAAIEESIIRALRSYGPTSNRDLWYRTSAPRYGRELFNQALEELVQRRMIVRQATNRVNRFIYRIAPPTRRRLSSEQLAAAIELKRRRAERAAAQAKPEIVA